MPRRRGRSAHSGERSIPADPASPRRGRHPPARSMRRIWAAAAGRGVAPEVVLQLTLQRRQRRGKRCRGRGRECSKLRSSEKRGRRPRGRRRRRRCPGRRSGAHTYLFFFRSLSFFFRFFSNFFNLSHSYLQNIELKILNFDLNVFKY